MTYWKWLLQRLRQKLWWQAVLYGILGVITAFLATLTEEYFPWEFSLAISTEEVSGLLGIISSSMLAVTTFSLGAMTSAFGGASSNVTPRATKLLMEDRLTHNVLSTFIGTFVFSIVGIVVLSTGSYGEQGRAVLFIITVFVIALIVVQLLRWVNHLISLGRVGATIERVEQAALSAMIERQEKPYLGANPWWDATPPEGAQPLKAEAVGYIQFVDISLLSEIAEREELQLYLPVNSGTLVYPDTPLLWVCGDLSEELIAELHDQFVLEPSRNFEQDPRFGLAVMAEIGSRALSPATNDAGTALDVIGRLTRLMVQWSKGREEADVEYPRLYLRPLSDADMFEDAFMIMTRDGAHLVEIQLRLHKSLAALQRIGSKRFRAAAAEQARLALARAEASEMFPEDLKRIKEVMQTC